MAAVSKKTLIVNWYLSNIMTDLNRLQFEQTRNSWNWSLVSQMLEMAVEKIAYLNLTEVMSVSDGGSIEPCLREMEKIAVPLKTKMLKRLNFGVGYMGPMFAACMIFWEQQIMWGMVVTWAWLELTENHRRQKFYWYIWTCWNQLNKRKIMETLKYVCYNRIDLQFFQFMAIFSITLSRK